MRRGAVLILLLIGLALAGGVPGMRLQLKGAWDEWNSLRQKRADLNGRLSALAARRALLLEALKGAEAEAPTAPEGEPLQAWAQDALRMNHAELLPPRSDETSHEEEQGGPGSLTLAFQGEYHDVMQVLADWRALPLRLASLTLRRAESPSLLAGRGVVEACAILESLQ